jgi:hypothetical protein
MSSPRRCATGVRNQELAEHPRWPSAGTTVYHFGCWSAALHTVGLPTLSVEHDPPLPERVATARALPAADESVPSFAAQLGMHVHTVHRYLAASVCARAAARHFTAATVASAWHASGRLPRRRERGGAARVAPRARRVARQHAHPLRTWEWSPGRHSRPLSRHHRRHVRELMSRHGSRCCVSRLPRGLSLRRHSYPRLSRCGTPEHVGGRGPSSHAGNSGGFTAHVMTAEEFTTRTTIERQRTVVANERTNPVDEHQCRRHAVR